MKIRTLRELCVHVKIHTCGSFVIHVHAEPSELRADSHAKAEKCKSLRIGSNMFTLLFQLEGWSIQKASGCVQKQSYAVVLWPHPTPPQLSQKIHTNFTVFWCGLHTWRNWHLGWKLGTNCAWLYGAHSSTFLLTDTLKERSERRFMCQYIWNIPVSWVERKGD